MPDRRTIAIGMPRDVLTLEGSSEDLAEAGKILEKLRQALADLEAHTTVWRREEVPPYGDTLVHAENWLRSAHQAVAMAGIAIRQFQLGRKIRAADLDPPPYREVPMPTGQGEEAIPPED